MKSNQEGGAGYCDICVQDQNRKIGALIELKYSKTDEGMELACDEALKQIESKDYSEIFNKRFTKKIINMALPVAENTSWLK